jgi:hypothetical protein
LPGLDSTGQAEDPLEKIQLALKLRQEGLSYSQIAAKMGVSRARAFQLAVQGNVAGG